MRIIGQVLVEKWECLKSRLAKQIEDNKALRHAYTDLRFTSFYHFWVVGEPWCAEPDESVSFAGYINLHLKPSEASEER